MFASIGTEKRASNRPFDEGTGETLSLLETVGGPSGTVLVVLPELSIDGELPPGVHIAGWQEFISFRGSSPAGCAPSYNSPPARGDCVVFSFG